MAAPIFCIVVLDLLVSRSSVSSQTYNPQRERTQITPTYTTNITTILETTEWYDEPSCRVTPELSNTTYLLSNVPSLTVNCEWPSTFKFMLKPYWWQRSRLADTYIRTEFHKFINATQSTAVVSFPTYSKIHKGEKVNMILWYRVIGYVPASKMYSFSVQKSQYNGRCQDSGDCYLTNSKCDQGRCLCLPGFIKENNYTCSLEPLRPSCRVTPDLPSAIYLPSRVPRLTCTCAMPRATALTLKPLWTLESPTEHADLQNEVTSFSGFIQSTAVVSFPFDSKLRTGEKVFLILSYKIPGFVNRSRKFYFAAQKSQYHGPCQENGDCYLTNSRCYKGLCQCFPGYSKENSYTCSDPEGRHVGESCERSSQCTKYDDISYCSPAGYCECGYPFKAYGRYCHSSTEDSSIPVPWTTVIAVVVSIVVISLFARFLKRRSLRSNAGAVPRISVAGNVASTDAAVQTSEWRDDPPAYDDIISAEAHKITVEAPPPRYDQLQQVWPFSLQT